MSPNRPITDNHEIIKHEVCQHMRPFVEATMEEHEQTREEVRRLHDTVEKINKVNIHDIIQYSLIAIISMFLLIIPQCS